MAVLSEESRAKVTAEWMQLAKGPHTILKPDVRAAVNGLDTFYNDNAAAANQSIPQPARSGMSLADKALLSNLIVNERYVNGS